MKLTEKDGLRLLEPDEGLWLYKDDQTTGRIFSDFVYLAVNDSPENWGECTTEEKEAYEDAHRTPMEDE